MSGSSSSFFSCDKMMLFSSVYICKSYTVDFGHRHTANLEDSVCGLSRVKAITTIHKAPYIWNSCRKFRQSIPLHAILVVSNPSECVSSSLEWERRGLNERPGSLATRFPKAKKKKKKKKKNEEEKWRRKSCICTCKYLDVSDAPTYTLHHMYKYADQQEKSETIRFASQLQDTKLAIDSDHRSGSRVCKMQKSANGGHGTATSTRNQQAHQHMHPAATYQEANKF